MANPNVEAAYFWVQIGQNETNEKFKVKGSDFPNVAKGPEMVWVQRGDDHYWTWYGQPNDLNSPDYSYRFNYFVEGFNEGLPGDQRNQPDGDGVINLSLYFGSPGPYPTNEWRNIRNQQIVVKDLDNKELILKNNPDLKEGDVCRITHEGGDFEAWYVVDTPDGNNFIKFKTLYRKSEDDDRERTDIKRTGSRPNPDGTQVLRFDFYAKENAKPYNRIADNDWVWAQAKDDDNNWQHYKVSGKNFKALFGEETTNFEVTYGTVYFNMRMHNTSETYVIERVEDGRTWNVSGSYTNSSLGVGNYSIPMTSGSGCQWFRLEYSNHAKFDFKPSFNTSTVTCMFKTLFNCTNFNSSVNHFDMSNCTNTSQMFYNCQKFNHSIAEWDFSKSTNAYAMFYNCRGFNNTATNIKVGAANCVNMFRNCTTFNKSISGSDFSKAINVRNMFYNCSAFNQPIAGLDFSNVDAGNLGNMFRDCTAFNQDFTGVTWPANARFERTFFNCVNLYQTKFNESFPFPADTDAVIFPMYNVKTTPSIANWTQPMPRITQGLFAGWRTFNQRVSHLDLSQCIDFSYTFSNDPAFNASDIGNLDVSGVQSLAGVFNGATGFKRDIGNWDVSECKNFSYMFANTANRNYNIGGWDTSNATNMSFMFRNSIVGDDLSGWDVSKVENFRNMFYEWGTTTTSLSTSDKLDIKIDNWDMRSATNIQNMFKDAGNNYYIETINTNAWRMPQMKYNPNLSNIVQQAWYDWDRTSSWNYSPIISGVPGFSLPVIEPGYEPTYTILVGRRNGTSSDTTYFACTNVDKVVLGEGQGEVIIDLSRNQFTLSSYYEITQIDLFERSEEGPLRFTTKSGSNAHRSQYWSFMEPYGPHPELMNAPTNMYGAFTQRNTRYSPTQISGLQFINTSKVEDMSYMFAGINGWSGGENNDISKWDVSNVNNMDIMFQNSTTPSFGDLSEWCVKNVPSKPREWPDKNNDIVTKNPLWGLCPTDPDFELPPWIMPDGAWNNFFQSYFWTWEDYVGIGPYGRIETGGIRGYWYRANRGTGDWEQTNYNVDSINVDAQYEYIFATNEESNSIKWLGTHEEMYIKAADTANVGNMSCMFFNMRNFNSDISKWDVSNVWKINNMFNNARAFNQDLSDWDFSNVTRSTYWDRNTSVWQSSYKPEIP